MEAMYSWNLNRFVDRRGIEGAWAWAAFICSLDIGGAMEEVGVVVGWGVDGSVWMYFLRAGMR